jgi:hypothetical protein
MLRDNPWLSVVGFSTRKIKMRKIISSSLFVSGSKQQSPNSSFLTSVNSRNLNLFGVRSGHLWGVVKTTRKNLFQNLQLHLASKPKYASEQKSDLPLKGVKVTVPDISAEEIKRENYRESYLPSYCCVQVTPEKTISGHVPYYFNQKMGFWKTKSSWNRWVWYKRAQMAYETCCAHSERTEFYECKQFSKF